MGDTSLLVPEDDHPPIHLQQEGQRLMASDKPFGDAGSAERPGEEALREA